MTDSGRSTGLRIIFSFFLGLMLTAVFGVGVYTFYPPPEEFNTQIRELNRREEMIRDSRPADQLTEADRAQIREVTQERYDLQDALREAERPWGRTTSILLMIAATLCMAVSLIRADQLPVISNGLLLGGVFTMLYGLGWIIATDTSTARFVVMAIALVVTLALAYIRFVRSGKRAVDDAGAAVPDAGDLADIELRLRALEERMQEAARVLGQTGP
jgi:type VI protein secretion system component VasK